MTLDDITPELFLDWLEWSYTMWTGRSVVWFPEELESFLFPNLLHDLLLFLHPRTRWNNHQLLPDILNLQCLLPVIPLSRDPRYTDKFPLRY